jgi:iron complex outermembrane recepter protein
MKSFFQTLLLFMALTMSYTMTLGQSDTATAPHYDNLSLKDLLGMKIVSVSKNPELWFEAPLSATVITKEEIRRTGCTSIMEALRLAPGVIVREQTNGNYDIHLRGLDNTPPNASFDMASTTTLVMIDNRPIYSYLRGGTFWETLPVDINDVEKIEIVRGPAAALYGPNAVNGVINIITRRPKHDGLYLLANAQQGSNRTSISNVSVGHKWAKWDLVFSGNYQGRERSQTSYFEFYGNRWIDNPDYFQNFIGDTVRNVEVRYPDPGLAMQKSAANVFITYRPSKAMRFDLSSGTQHSKVQKVAAENETTPLSTASAQSKYVDLRVQTNGFSGQLSFNKGLQNVDFDPSNKFDFYTFDANIEYNYTRKNFSLKPGLSYRKAMYDDTKYSDVVRKTGIFNTRGEIITKSASLRGEYKMMQDKLRIVAAAGANKFNFPDTVYLSFQFAATYKIDAKHLLRAVFSRSPRSSNIFDTYVDQTLAYFPSGFQEFTRFGLVGDKNLKLLTADLLEIGYRATVSAHLNLDLELFDIKTKNSSIMVTAGPYTRTEGPNTIVEVPVVAVNMPMRAHQQGATISLHYSTSQWQVKPFVTIQRTRLKDYSPYSNTPDAGMGPNHMYSGIGTVFTHKGTPTVFGGASVNYVATGKTNFNLNGYYYSAQEYHHLSNFIFNDGIRGIDHIKGKLILNLTASYEPAPDLHFFVSGKNLLNMKSREFFRADEVPFRMLAGINYEF